MKTAGFDFFAAELPRQRLGGAQDSPATVSDLAQQARTVVESRIQPLWVRGEITDFKRHRNGHWYFCLRDKTAQVRCVVWSKDQLRIPAAPDDGMQVVLFGQMTVYAARGDLQLKVTRIEAEGDGLWRKAMAETLTRLRADGLLEEARKRPIPRFPKCIAVVTSPGGAALRDIVAVLRERNSGARIVVCAATVQGDVAAREIVFALKRVARWGKADVVIIGRGGGGKEDLWAFNDERVARAVASCPVPVISAVGHEVDMTVCDAVADLRAPTPSAAAAAACVAREQLERAFALAARDLSAAMQARVRHARSDIDRMSQRIITASLRTVAAKKHLIANFASRLNSLSPLATLARGYAVARDPAGSALTSAKQFTAGLRFELLLHDGQIAAETKEA
ncbi:MAG: exodeoxyribonuclease VII large subunit [Gemmatimonadaceae bacterium]